MNSLFIIGNGFDLAHGIKLSYEDFHNFLETNYSNVNFDRFYVPEPIIMPDGSVNFSDYAVRMFLIKNISDIEGNKWSDLETSLWKIYLDDYVQDFVDIEILEDIKFEDLSNSDIFLTFNYTRTLEDVYKAKNVCHIHGEQDRELVFGHGEDVEYYNILLNKKAGSIPQR